MKSSLDSFDYLLNDDILEQNWKQLTGGYTNLLVEQQLQTDFVESLESDHPLSVFVENSFTQFSQEMNLTAIERLTGIIENKANQPLSNTMPERRLKKEDPLLAKRKDTTRTKPKLMAKQQQIVPNATAEAVKPLSKLSQIKTPKKGRNQQAAAITAAFARAELNNRAVSLGRGNEWSDKKLDSSHFVNPQITQNTDEANTSDVNSAEVNLGMDQKEFAHDHNKNVAVNKEQAFTSSSNKKIDRLMDEKIKDLQSTKQLDSKRVDTQRNQTEAASSINQSIFAEKDKKRTNTFVKPANQSANNASMMNDVSSSVSSVARPVSLSTGVGGLRGLAALAKANSDGDKPSLSATSETIQNVTEAKVTQKTSLNVVDSNNSSSQSTTVASIAKLLADEARRAGINLEKFQP